MEYRRSSRIKKNSSEISTAATTGRGEFSEALRFAAFASLVVEMVASLDNVIEEVEELGRIACFKVYDNTRDPTADDLRCEKAANVVISVGAAE
ncbi:unnamed protein product [Cochlearia groenlandica]